jgi:hypothetical protein
MPAKPPPPPVEPDPAPADTPASAAPEPEQPGAVAVPDGRLPAGAYLFTGPIATQYLDVPLTARPAEGGSPATVFDWPFGAPNDGRWEPTRRKPNQRPDNEPADSEEE